MTDISTVKIAYFGGEPIGTPILETLLDAGITPALIICNPDRPSGRGHKLTPPPLKVLAEERDIPLWQPESFKDKMAVSEKLADFDLFVVVAYNKILPRWLIELPKHKTINVHPSLLPKLRGANPIRTAILEDTPEEVGVSIMLLDEKMDHGPLLAQEKLEISENAWPMRGQELDAALATLGGELLADTIPKYLNKTLTPTTQNHDAATYTKKMEKTDGELLFNPHNLPSGNEAYQTLLKIRAYDGWPGTYFMHDGKRIKIKDAERAVNGSLRILRIVPEGKSEIGFFDYFKGV